MACTARTPTPPAAVPIQAGSSTKTTITNEIAEDHSVPFRGPSPAMAGRVWQAFGGRHPVAAGVNPACRQCSSRKATIDLRMSRRLRPSPSSFVRNLAAGPYSPFERMRLMVGNVRRKAGGRGCCGKYGEAGCWMTKEEGPAGRFVNEEEPTA